MASRMERYHQREERSVRNEELYKNIQNLENYTNIEGVIAIDKTNEIDITRVKAMLQSREEYQKGKRYRQLVSQEEEETQEPEPTQEENKNYDIRDVLTKAKETRVEPDENYRTLKNVNYDVIKKLNLKATPEEEEALKELIDTITIRTQMEEQANVENQEAPASDDLGLLDDLKSNTMVGDPSSIKKIIEEAKVEEEKQEEEAKLDNTSLDNIDKSFYTSSLGFSDRDFEDLKSLGADIKRHNILLRILIIGIGIAFVAIFVFFCFSLLTK